VLGSAVLASATSWAVLRLLLGNEPLFKVPQYQVVHPVELLLYLGLGIAGGVVSAVFTKLLGRLRARFLRMPTKTQWYQPLAGGLMVGAMGWFVPQLMGVGYKYVGDALNNGMAVNLMALLLSMKLVSVCVCYASGNAGGIFGPSLFLGAMLGGIVGGAGHHILPAQTATPGAYALVGMGAVFAGVVRAPMTSVVMIFETTRDYAVIVPLMISNLVSYFVASRLQREPIYEVLARQDGIHLPISASRNVAGKRSVSQVLRAATEVLDADVPASDALKSVSGSGMQAWPIVDNQGVIGMIPLGQLRELASDGDRATKRLREFASLPEFPHLHADHSLDVALDRMGATQLDVLPVVSRADVHQLEGIVTLADVLALYGVGPRTES